MPCLTCSADRSPSSRYSSINSSSASAAASTVCSRASRQASSMSSGISSSVKFVPILTSSQKIALPRTRSTMPRYLSSAPIGSCNGTAVLPRRSLIWPTTLRKSAPERSILLTKASLGTLYLFAWRHTVSDCGSTPPTAQNTAQAPSRTLSDLSTSMVKSTCPGVSMILIRCSGYWPAIPFQKQVVAADVIVMPRSCSCSIQSMVAAPSCTSPILWETPV